MSFRSVDQRKRVGGLDGEKNLWGFPTRDEGAYAMRQSERVRSMAAEKKLSASKTVPTPKFEVPDEQIMEDLIKPLLIGLVAFSAAVLAWVLTAP